jgi:hypothetical protein
MTQSLHITDIEKLPITQIRQKLVRHQNARNFSIENLAETIIAIRAGFAISEEAEDTIGRTIKDADNAINTGITSQYVRLDTSVKQLIWAAHLTYAHLNPEVTEPWAGEDVRLSDTRLWRQLTESQDAHRSIVSCVHLLSEHADKQTKIRWGVPGSHFYQSSENHLINIDFLGSLTIGLDNIRETMLHEVGHQRLTLEYPQFLQQTKQEIDALLKKKQDGTLDEEDYVALALKEKAWNTMNYFYNACEDNTVNRFAILVGEGRHEPHDYKYSMNAGFLIGSTAHHKKESAFDSDNTETEEQHVPSIERQKVGTLIRAALLGFYSQNGLFDRNNPNDLQRFGLDPSLFDNPDDLLTIMNIADDGTKGSLAGLQPKMHLSRRERLQEDFDEAAYARDFSVRRSAIINDLWEVYAAPLMLEILQEYEQSVRQALQDTKDGKRRVPEGSGINVPGAGNMPDIEPPPRSPDQDIDHNQSSSPASRQEPQDPGQSIEDMLEEAGLGDPPTERDGSPPPEGMQNRKPTVRDPFHELTGGCLDDFMAWVENNQPAIALAEQSLISIQAQQQDYTPVFSTKTRLTPQRAGSLGKQLHQGKYRQLQTRQLAGSPVKQEHMKVFRGYEDKPIPPTVNFWFWVDGSGSMCCNLQDSDKTMMETAMEVASVFFSASQNVDGVNVYIGLWGPDRPELLIDPSMTLEQAGSRLAAAKNGFHSSTNLAPAFAKMAEIMVDQNTASLGAHSDHICIIGDGDVYDADTTIRYIQAYNQNASNVTVDFGVFAQDIDEYYTDYSRGGKGVKRRYDPSEDSSRLESVTKKLNRQGVSAGIVTNIRTPGEFASNMFTSLQDRLCYNQSFQNNAAGKQNGARRVLDAITEINEQIALEQAAEMQEMKNRAR